MPFSCPGPCILTSVLRMVLLIYKTLSYFIHIPSSVKLRRNLTDHLKTQVDTTKPLHVGASWTDEAFSSGLSLQARLVVPLKLLDTGYQIYIVVLVT
jgi:hypothetical protein